MTKEQAQEELTKYIQTVKKEFHDLWDSVKKKHIIKKTG